MNPKSWILAGVVAAGMSLPAVAEAANAVATGNVNLRTGPGTGYGRITTIPGGAGVTIYGCLRGHAWCDVSFSGYRGWTSGNYLAYLEGGQRYYVPQYAARYGVPIISFSFGNYHDRYYRDRPWYRQRDWRSGRDWRRDRDWRRRDRDRDRRSDWQRDEWRAGVNVLPQETWHQETLRQRGWHGSER